MAVHSLAASCGEVVAKIKGITKNRAMSGHINNYTHSVVLHNCYDISNYSFLTLPFKRGAGAVVSSKVFAMRQAVGICLKLGMPTS